MKNNFVHFSVDDVIGIFEDIYFHNYSSVFQNKFLNDWKRLHEESGLKLSCYCYYHKNKFSLDQFSDKYKQEFEKNSGWLRFGVHAFDSDVAKSSDWRTYYISYIRVVEELIRICGERTIDFFPRLDCYKIPYKAWKRLDAYKYGPKGLLGNDRDEGSYFLGSEEEKILREQGAITVFNKMILRTSIRLEDMNDNIDSYEISYPFICFTHEWLWDVNGKCYRKMIKRICDINRKNGGYYAFPEEVLATMKI